MVGSFTTSAGYQHAFRLEADNTLTDIGTLNGPLSTSSACALDVDGRVGGRSGIGSATHAFVSSGGAPSDVDAFGSTFSTVAAISNGVGVGSFTWSASTGEMHAFVYTAADGAADLNTRIPAGSGWILSEATAVNSNGQIAGHALVAGSRRTFRLTPGAAADTTAPVITSVSATPSSVTPPNKLLVDVAVSAAATDDRDPSPVCTVSAVDGHGAPAADFSITGPLAGRVRATGGATYSFMVTCSDAAGNAASRSVDVAVPPDAAPPVFTSLSATPTTIWPPKGQMVMVTTSATATDDSGDAPTCTLASITGPGTTPADVNVTGANTGAVKAVGGRTYTFNETCVDGSGNGASLSVDVTVPPDVTAPVIASLTATPSSVTPPNHAMVPVTVSVSASDDVDEAPACALSAVTGGPAGDVSITGPFSAAVRAVGNRTYSLRVTCSDAAGNASAGSVDVVVPPDTTAPVVTSLTVTPAVVWPPNDALVAVTVAVAATDDSAETPACSLSAVTSSGTSFTADDYSITGQYSARVRAVGGRTYSLRVTCSDAAGNRRDASVNVVVPPDTTAPVITALSVSPDHIWPPNNKMESVTLSVTATDDVDPAPTCSLTSITGAPAGYAVVTGAFTANVKSEKDVVYTLNVTCGDRAGNKSQGSIRVAVNKDSPSTTSSKK
jgi:hypothetical protein